jgi:hypothetical protein
MPLGPTVAQVVVIGKKIYIGGGDMQVKNVGGSEEGVVEGSADGENKDYPPILSILECSVTGEGPQWKTIVAPTFWFAMATVDNQLIVAGGMDANTSEPVDQVHVLDNHNDTWLQPFPASSVPTVWASAIGYKKWLLVVGGWLTADLDCPLDVVQVLDTSSKQWYTASLLPTPATRPSLAIIQDTLYIAWSNITEKALKIFIPTLLSDAKSYSLSVKPTCDWQTLPTTLTSFPLFVSFHGHLLAVGDSETSSSTIAMYLPHIKQWQKVEELPSPRAGCACCFLPATKVLVVIGGSKDKGNHPIFTMEICQLDN